MSGYYYECPSCSKVHPIESRPVVWFDVDRVDPVVAEKLLTGTPLNAIPVIGGDGAVGSVYRFPLPDRKCGACGQDGCVDCIPDEVCSTCAHDPDYTGLKYKCPGCKNCEVSA